MFVGADYADIEPNETDLFSFDFVKSMPVGDTLVSSVWTCTVDSASLVADGSAASRLSGAATAIGTVTTQKISGMVDGVIYVLEATVVTTRGLTISLWSKVTCKVAD